MKCHPIDVVEVKVVKDYQLFLRFQDGKSGIVDISKIVPFKGVFEPLNDKTFFSTVSINKDIGTICWHNGADLSPSYLRKHLK